MWILTCTWPSKFTTMNVWADMKVAITPEDMRKPNEIFKTEHVIALSNILSAA